MSGLTRVLIVDDEERIRLFLRITLRAAGYEILTAATGKDAVEACVANHVDLVLLDLGLPDISGLDVIRAIHARDTTPIIVVSVRSEDADKVAALDAGANDYVQKPFSTAELLARVRATLRSTGGRQTGAQVIQTGALRIDIAAHEVKLDEQIVHFSRKEFELLVALASASGRVCTHRQLLEQIWGPTHRRDVQYLRVYVGQLRDKLGDDANHPKYVANEPGIGYRWIVHDDAAPPGD